MSNRASLTHLTRTVADFDVEDVTLQDGSDVGVRQISRAEYLHAAKGVDDDGKVDPVKFERRIIAAGMVEPEMDEHEVAAWQKIPGAGQDVAAVLDKIMTWSGFREGAAKSGV